MTKFPVCVVVYLTDYCPLKCKHCFLTQQKSLNQNMITFNKLKEILKTLKKNNVCMIAYTGGDPMINPDIFKILKYTTKLDMLPLLGISGIGINSEIAQQIYDSGVRCVQIGLNGSNSKLNDNYRGAGTFDEIKKTIHTLQEKNINVNLSFCLDKKNYKDLNNMLNFSKSMNAFKVKVEFWKKVNDSTLKELNKNEIFKINEFCIDYMNKNNKIDWIQCAKNETNLTRIHKSSVIIMPNGDVKHNELSVSLGNIYTSNIDDII